MPRSEGAVAGFLPVQAFGRRERPAAVYGQHVAIQGHAY
jgi:hypothetical protein